MEWEGARKEPKNNWKETEAGLLEKRNCDIRIFFQFTN